LYENPAKKDQEFMQKAKQAKAKTAKTIAKHTQHKADNGNT
jgi:hypothetical protein